MNSSAKVTGCDDIIKRLREAIAAGPTPGPWFHAYDFGQIGSVENAAGHVILQAQQTAPGREDVDRRNKTAAYIAAASPDNIAALLDRLDKLAGEHAMMKSLLLSEQAEKREISAECERLRAALDIARDYVATNVAYLRERYRGREQFGRVHEAEGDLAAIDAARAAEREARKE